MRTEQEIKPDMGDNMDACKDAIDAMPKKDALKWLKEEYDKTLESLLDNDDGEPLPFAQKRTCIYPSKSWDAETVGNATVDMEAARKAIREAKGTSITDTVVCVAIEDSRPVFVDGKLDHHEVAVRLGPFPVGVPALPPWRFDSLQDCEVEEGQQALILEDSAEPYLVLTRRCGEWASDGEIFGYEPLAFMLLPRPEKGEEK